MVMRVKGGWVSNLKIVLENLILYSFSSVLFYLTILLLFPVHWTFKIFTLTLYIIIYYIWKYGIYFFKRIIEVFEKNEAHILLPCLMIGLSFISLTMAINILVFLFNNDSFFQDAGKLVNLFNKDEIEFLANSTLLSVIILFITSYFFYKYFFNRSILIFKKYTQRNTWTKLNTEALNKSMLNTFTVVIVFAGFLPVFIEQIVEHDKIIEKIKSLILGIFLTTLIPYFHLLNNDSKY